MNRMEALTAKRQAERHGRARHAVDEIRQRAAEAGLSIQPVGSFARGDFRLHSDIDLLVRGPIDRCHRVAAERIVAESLRGVDIPYDLIFEEDLTAERLEEFLRDSL
ncbi:nucleotidyltransferase [Rhizobium rhizosphaerae]|uniref:Nucleotidyltransferase n=2 Tax=Xaviernesmea rhizosphaerae TaxID=1672749 RepID=A0ABX3P7M2_9HYPH|nr:nucleotidyltransferase [Xaviernesmea rhizosphaerae]